MDKGEVLKLAKLARIDMGDAEAEKLSHEFEAILNYVAEVKAVAPSTDIATPEKDAVTLKNVMREDDNAHESGMHTEALLAEAPATENGFVKVKKIL